MCHKTLHINLYLQIVNDINEKIGGQLMLPKDFEDEGGLTKCEIHMENRKSIKLTDFTPRWPRGNDKKTGEDNREKPVYNKDWLAILVESDPLTIDERQKEYGEKVQRGEILTKKQRRKALETKVEEWTIQNDPRCWVQSHINALQGPSGRVYKRYLIKIRVLALWDRVSRPIYYNWIRYWVLIEKGFWAISRGRILYFEIRKSPYELWEKGPEKKVTVQSFRDLQSVVKSPKRYKLKLNWDFGPYFGIVQLYRHCIGPGVEKFVQQFYQFIDYRTTIATLAIGSQVFGTINYLHHYNQNEQSKKQLFSQQPFVPTFSSEERQKNHVKLIRGGVKELQDSGQVEGPELFGDYARPLARRVKYTQEILEASGATRTKVIYSPHDLLQTVIPRDDLITLRPHTRSLDAIHTETGEISKNLHRFGPAPPDTVTPQFRLYGDGLYLDKKTMKLKLRFGNEFISQEDDNISFEEFDDPMVPTEERKTSQECMEVLVEATKIDEKNPIIGAGRVTALQEFDETLEKIIFESSDVKADTSEFEPVESEVAEVADNNLESTTEGIVNHAKKEMNETTDKTSNGNFKTCYIPVVKAEIEWLGAEVDPVNATPAKNQVFATIENLKEKKGYLADADKNWAQGGLYRRLY